MTETNNAKTNEPRQQRMTTARNHSGLVVSRRIPAEVIAKIRELLLQDKSPLEVRDLLLGMGHKLSRARIDRELVALAAQGKITPRRKVRPGMGKPGRKPGCVDKTPRARRPRDEAKWTKIHAMRASGMSLAAIGAELGIRRSAVCYYFRDEKRGFVQK